ncbi:penicillin-binding transpeptidase domain-containing protein [Paenibacillus sp. MBLB4367]|uniref:penicillin-binding transpeptidase domain-containing protein n=1 Tax=Paenibacillus sp. MBLB4367 TaxID=3384767 RepID=UPI00390808C9
MEKKTKLRSLLLGVFFTLLFTGLVARMYWVQVVEASSLREKAEDIWSKSEVLAAKRGDILDRNDRTLAEEAVAYTVSVDPDYINQKKTNPKAINSAQLDWDIARGLAGILTTSQDPAVIAELEKKIYGLVTKKKSDGSGFLRNVEIKPEGWKIDGETKKRLDAFIVELTERTRSKLTGISITETQKRYYPSNRLASHVLGYIDKEGKAVGGIESTLDEMLRGKSGTLYHERDAMGVELPNSKISINPAENGKTVRLTIDQNIQYYVETALKTSYDKWKPKSMTAIAVDPQTMEILALANAPDFNPNKYWDVNSQSDYINHAVASQYEPGSTFKVVTLAGAVQEGKFDPNDRFVSGKIPIGGRELHDHETKGWGTITYMEGLLRSSNVAFVKLGFEKLGPKLLTDYIMNFGFGKKTGIALPNEIKGIVNMKYDSEYGTATYGQGQVLTTLLQQVAAYAAVANGGKLMEPHIIKDVIDPQSGEVIQSFEPKVVREVISPETAKQTSLYLEQVVANQDIGTGRRAYISDYRVAGKTGTANIVIPGKGYSTDTWVITFVGFAPVENPRLLVAVLADQPDLGGNYHKGGEVAAPVFKDIMTQSLRYMNVRGNTGSSASKTTAGVEAIAVVPDVTGKTLAEAGTLLKQTGLKSEVLGTGGKVLKQSPAAGTEIAMSQRVLLMTQESQGAQVPDMKGSSLREAMEICAELEVQCKASGEGYVASQSVSDEKGTKVVALELKPIDEQSAADEKKAADPVKTEDGKKTGSAGASSQQSGSGAKR